MQLQSVEKGVGEWLIILGGESKVTGSDDNFVIS